MQHTLQRGRRTLVLSLLSLTSTCARAHFLPERWSLLRGDGDIKGEAARVGGASSAEARSRLKPRLPLEQLTSQ